MDKMKDGIMQMLDLGEPVDQLSKVNSVLWFGHVLRKYENSFLRMAPDFRAKWTRKSGRPKKTWLQPVVEHSRLIELKENDANS